MQTMLNLVIATSPCLKIPMDLLDLQNQGRRKELKYLLGEYRVRSNSDRLLVIPTSSKGKEYYLEIIQKLLITIQKSLQFESDLFRKNRLLHWHNTLEVHLITILQEWGD